MHTLVISARLTITGTATAFLLRLRLHYKFARVGGIQKKGIDLFCCERPFLAASYQLIQANINKKQTLVTLGAKLSADENFSEPAFDLSREIK